MVSFFFFSSSPFENAVAVPKFSLTLGSQQISESIYIGLLSFQLNKLFLF